jgi:hypothetical protein
MDGYDIGEIFAEIELEVIKSLKRNLGKHYEDEILEGFKWPAWQTMKIKDLQRFRLENASLFKYYEPKLEASIEQIIKDQFLEGAKATAQQALKAGAVASDPMMFFNMPDRKVLALINEAKASVKMAQTSALRFANDQYRQIVFKSQMYAASGAGTLYKAVDMASKDFLDKGINSIEYANGSRVNIASYSEMAIRTANKKASLIGEGEMREQLDIDLVIVTQYGASSPTCLPWQGRVYVDDVYSNGNPDDYDGKYPRLSLAIEGGLFHPNCRHRASAYFEGITADVERIDEAQALANYNAEQKQRYNERKIRKYKRLSEGSLDEKNVEMYYGRQKAWEKIQRDHIDANPELRRNPWRESLHGVKSNIGPAQKIKSLSPNELSEYLERPYLQQRLDFVDKATRSPGFIPSGSLMDPKSVTIIAGPGSEKKIRDIATFVTNFGGKPEDWTKMTAKIESSAYVHDVHWFEMNHVQYRPVMKFRKVKK